MSYAFKVWLFFYILSLVFGFGLVGRLPPYVPIIIRVATMAIGFVFLFILDKREKKMKK